MSRRSKRKFNWDELSSEEEGDVKVSKKSDNKKVDTNKEDKKNDKIDNKPIIEDQTEKFSKLNVKSEKQSPTTTRSTRAGGIKREIEIDSIENDVSSNKKVKISKSPIIVKEEKSSKIIEEKPSKEEEVRHSTPIKATTKKENFVLPKVPMRSPVKADEVRLDDAQLFQNQILKLGKKSELVDSQNVKQTDSKDFDLPVINIKSIKMNIVKPESSKKFNKKPLNISVSPAKVKFSEIKIELTDEQRNWFNELMHKYDGNYDKEFDCKNY